MSLIRLVAPLFREPLVSSLISETMGAPLAGSDLEACLEVVSGRLGLPSCKGSGFDLFVSADEVARAFLFYMRVSWCFG